MSRALPRHHKRRAAFIGAAAVAPTGAVIAGTALPGRLHAHEVR